MKSAERTSDASCRTVGPAQPPHVIRRSTSWVWGSRF